MESNQARQTTAPDVRRDRFRVVGLPNAATSTVENTAANPNPETSAAELATGLAASVAFDVPCDPADAAALDFARDVLRSESRAILDQLDRLDRRFCDAVALLTECVGSVVVAHHERTVLDGVRLARGID